MKIKEIVARLFHLERKINQVSLSATSAGGDDGEIQFNSSGGLGAISGSSVSGTDLVLTRGQVKIEENTEALFDAGTLTNVTGNSVPLEDDTLTLADAANGTTKAVRFIGSRANKITVTHHADYNLTGNLTIEAWCYLENPTAFSPIISKGDSGGTFDLVVQSGGGYGANNYGWIRFGQSGTYSSTEGLAALRLNQWHHVAVTKSGTTLKFFVNGTLVKTDSSFNPTVGTDTDDVTIGHATDSFLTDGYLFRGALYDVRVWASARSDAEILANMNTLSSGTPLSRWAMQEGAGTSIDDTGSGGHDGVLSGSDYEWITVTENYATSGTRVSPEYDISTAQTISTSSISWTEVKPSGHTITVESRYSTDGGSTYSSYQTCTSGSTIPGLNTTIDLSNGRIQFRQTLASPTSKATPIFSDLLATFTTPAFEYNVGIANGAPEAEIDAGRNAIQGNLYDTGGAAINICAPRYGGVGDGVTDNTEAFQLALADLGAANLYTTSTGKIVFPKGDFYFASDMEVNHVVQIEGAGGDNAAPGTTLRFADGKGMWYPAGEVFGGYGTDQGAGKGSLLRGVRVISNGKANAPTATVNVSGLNVTWTAGTLFNKERWVAGTVVKIGSIYAKIDNWLSDTTATIKPLFYTATVSGATATLTYGNPFPAGLTSVAVEVDGVSYNLHGSTQSTTSVLTFSSSPAETGSRVIEIQSLGTLNAQTMTIFVNHGIEISGTVHFENVTVSGFAGNGIDINTGNYSYDNGRNSNTFTMKNVLSIDNEGHGFFVLGFNSNASTLVAPNGFNNRGHGFFESSSYGNTYIGPHTDSNRMEPFYASSATPIIGLYSEGNQPPSRFIRPSGVGTAGPVVIGGFQGAGITYDTDAMILSDAGPISGVSTLSVESGITVSGPITFDGSNDSAKWVNFRYGVAGATTSSGIQDLDGALSLITNTRQSGGGFGTPTNATQPSWWNLISSAGDYVRWYRAAATGGAPSFSQIAEINATGFSGNGSQLTALNGSNISSGTVPDARLSSNVTLQGNSTTGSGAIVLATGPTLSAPNLGTPASGNLSNCTALPVGSITGLGTGVGTFLATPSSANLKAAVTNETGDGALVFAESPTLVTPNIGAATGTSLNLGGQTLTDILTVTQSINFGEIAADTMFEETVSVTGAALGDTVIATPSGKPEFGLHWNACVSASDEVTVRITNATGDPIDPASRTWRITVLKF